MEISKVFCCVFLSLIVKFTEGYQDVSDKCTDFSDSCLQNTLQAALPKFMEGLPEYGMESLDPFQVENLVLKLPGGLNIVFKHGVSKGFKDCSVNSAKLVQNKLEVQIQCNLTIRGRYKSSGQLLFFPVNGDGDAIIKCNKLQITALFKVGSRLEANGQVHLYIKHFNSTHKFGGRVSYVMTNIFKGNPEISKAVLEFINSNWRLVAEELGKPIVDVGVNAIKKNIDIMLHIVPSHSLIGTSDIFNN